MTHDDPTLDPIADAPTEADVASDTQERSDATAATEANPDPDTLAIDMPPNEAVEGNPTPQETDLPGAPEADEAEAQADGTAPSTAGDEDEDAPDNINVPPQTTDQAVVDVDVTQASPSDDTASADGAPDAPSDTPAAPSAPSSPVKRGELVRGVVAEASPTRVLVDLGEIAPGLMGMVTDTELKRMTSEQTDALVTGAPLDVYVVRPNGPQGNVLLSITRAQEEIDWREAERYRQERLPYDGRIAGYNKGGLIVRFERLRGFVPQSQISDTRRRALGSGTPDERYASMVNEAVVVKVIEVDKERNRLILSERAAAREMREKSKGRLIEELTVGEVRTGTVVSLEDFGAFVDIGGAEGLVHLTEISHGHVTHPRQVLQEGQQVEVEVINIDDKNKRIGLSMKRRQNDPWDEVAAAYQQGQLVRARITKLTRFGAFAELVDAQEVEGLVHISELSNTRVAHPRDVVNVGEEYTLRVVKVDAANRRLGLSLKQVRSTEYLDEDLNRLFEEQDRQD